MKKKIILLFVTIFLLTIINFTGCSALRASNQAKEMIEEYFIVYNDEKIDECVDMFGDEIIDDIGDKNTTELIFNSRRYLLGEVEKTRVSSFDSNSNFSETQVVLEVEANYENVDEIVNEKYTFLLRNGKMEIVGIDFGNQKQPIADQLIADYFEEYYNMQHAKKYYIPYSADNYFDEDNISMQANYAKEAGGEYVDHEIIDYTYYYDELDWDDDIYYLAQIDAELEFDNEVFVLYAEISKQDNEVSFNYLEYYPQNAYRIIDDYFNKSEKGDSSDILKMYSTEFFKYSDISMSDWQTSVLDALQNDYGNFVEYSILGWEYEEIDLDDGAVEVYSFTTISYYENATFDEYITIIKDKDSQAIIGHSISIR